MKKHDDDTAAKKPEPAKREVDIATPPEAHRTTVGGGTGAAPDPGLTPDPNQDTARAAAMDTYNQKLAAGEDPGERPADPVAMSNQPKRMASGPVAPGMRRVKVTSPVSTGAVIFEVGDVVDLSEADADSLGANVEAFEAKAKK